MGLVIHLVKQQPCSQFDDTNYLIDSSGDIHYSVSLVLLCELSRLWSIIINVSLGVM